jgi:hypothetical protein
LRQLACAAKGKKIRELLLTLALLRRVSGATFFHTTQKHPLSLYLHFTSRTSVSTPSASPFSLRSAYIVLELAY